MSHGDPEKCGEACGYAAAFLAAVCFGSFGVPVKSEVVSRLDVDPLVMQSYKSAMGFLTCWIIIPMGQPLRFTTWGILSGLFWVPGGVAGIYGIRTAGLAVALGTWSSLIVLTSFAWGIFIFEEHVKSKSGACCACGTLIAGLIGMSIFSRPRTKKDPESARDEERTKMQAATESIVADEDGVRKRIHSSKDSKMEMRKEEPLTESKVVTCKRVATKKAPLTKAKTGVVKSNNEIVSAQSSLPLPPLEMEYLLDRQGGSFQHDNKSLTMTLFAQQVTLTKRQMGLLACMFNGLWGGTSMIPLHFAAAEGYGGPSYVISFCCGSMLVTIALWIMRFLFELYRLEGALGKAYHALPSFHTRQMWLQGCLSGVLWSVGNFFAIISVTHLGQGVGYSFTQASMLVGGLWGIFRFKEIEGVDRILKWFLSACIALTGIMWLSYEHAS
ncbi:hypothetical protein ACHAW5_010098 [Stephanodiscus triporus]|uniref:EamA domain-containing protein n=1 Tax=Stephanodiscus triporus TaxID=2934178 RepID=A0ABD3P9Y4_9STRA